MDKQKLFERYFNNRNVSLLPWKDLMIKLIIVIPVKADMDLFKTLNSLESAVIYNKMNIGIIIVINHHIDDDDKIKETNMSIVKRLEDVKQVTNMYIHSIQYESRHKSERGVGYARRMGMDAASYFFVSNNTDGVICSIDADTNVDENYISSTLHDYAKRKWDGICYGIQHRFNEVTLLHKQAMMCYELGMYYNRYAKYLLGHPYYFITIGSGFATSANAYIKIGGMSNKEAGEDFYFIQKLVSAGNFMEHSTVNVYPSARLSFRTPFGTGQSVNEIMQDGGLYLTNNFDAYVDLKRITDKLSDFYQKSDAEVSLKLRQWDVHDQMLLQLMEFEYYVNESNKNSSSLKQFEKRFYNHFNGFKLIRYMNLIHQDLYKRQDVLFASRQLIRRFYNIEIETLEQALIFFYTHMNYVMNV